MTSIPARPRQLAAESNYFINVGDLTGKIFAYDSSASGPRFSTATWAGVGVTPTNVARYTSTLRTAGNALLRDQGKTVVSANRTFRKVQLVVSSFSTFGVNGQQGTAPYAEDYLTGYIELGILNGNDGLNFTPVAKYGV